jgi:hypothetical protein
VQRAAANRFGANVAPVIRQLQAQGISGYAALAAALNERGVRTARGASWHPTSVANLLRRGAAA